MISIRCTIRILKCIDIDHFNALCLLCFVCCLGHKEVPNVHFKSIQIKLNFVEKIKKENGDVPLLSLFCIYIEICSKTFFG